MEIELINGAFEKIHVLDTFKSLIWTDRYWKYGDFDIIVGATDQALNHLISTKYLKLKESEHIMTLETFAIDTDVEDGAFLILKGRSLESILDRRVIDENTVIDGNLQIGIQGFLNDHIISPTNSDRQINNFEFQTSTDPAITNLAMNGQFLGRTIYAIISDICESRGIGFKVTLTATNKFRFELYAGVDRSYEQSTNAHVVFSPEFDNLLNGSYIESSRLQKTHAYVVGEAGVGNTRSLVIVYSGTAESTGLDRREMYFEANIMRNTPGGILSEEDYLAQLSGRGLEELAKKEYVKGFDGEVDSTMYNYGDDFFMGDICQLSDGYGHGAYSRVTEMIYSQDKAGIKMYPTFTTFEATQDLNANSVASGIPAVFNPTIDQSENGLWGDDIISGIPIVANPTIGQ